MHWEMALLAQGGMNNAQVPRAATLNPAKTLGMDDQLGSLEPGKLADLIVLDANPLQDIKNSNSVRYTMVSGRLYDSLSMNEIGNYDRPRTRFYWELNSARAKWNEAWRGTDMLRAFTFASVLLLHASQSIADGRTHTVCTQRMPATRCQFVGPDAIQQAIDQAASGDTILLKPGRYGASRFRDIPYLDFKVRGFVVIDGVELAPARLLDGHVGLWLHESAYLRLRDSLVKNNDGSGIAAYDSSVAHITDSVFDANLDDGLYTEHQATLFVTGSLVLNNKPIGVGALHDSRILLTQGALFGNATSSESQGGAKVVLGADVEPQK